MLSVEVRARSIRSSSWTLLVSDAREVVQVKRRKLLDVVDQVCSVFRGSVQKVNSKLGAPRRRRSDFIS